MDIMATINVKMEQKLDSSAVEQIVHVSMEHRSHNLDTIHVQTRQRKSTEEMEGCSDFGKSFAGDGNSIKNMLIAVRL